MDGRDIKFPFKINVTTGEANTLGASHVLSDILLFSLQDLVSSSQQPSEEVTTVSSIIQMRKLRARECKELGQQHRAGKRPSQDSNPDSLLIK